MAVGDTVRADGIEYIVVFDGRQSLLGERRSIQEGDTSKKEKRQARRTWQKRAQRVQRGLKVRR